MGTLKPIQIVGGGLAGLTLGIGLRQQGVPVTIWEAGHYPRHRVCGEFISGRGQDSLRRLDLLEKIVSCREREARTVAFFSDTAASRAIALPRPALCVSRFRLDELLAREFQRLGGEIRERKRWPERPMAEGMVRASGRRTCPSAGSWRWLGLKVHARQVCLKADLEMHLTRDGYVGLCQLDGEVNICGLFRSRTPFPDVLGRWRDYLRGTPGSYLDQRCANALFDESSFCSVAGLSFRPRYGDELPDCAVGDAFSMIPPVTGNGMSMAFESAELAIQPLYHYSQGKQSWDECQRLIRGRCSDAFRVRLWLASWLHNALFHPRLQAAFVRLMHSFPWAFTTLFTHTR